MSRKPTLADVAKMAGVSTSTASRALRSSELANKYTAYRVRKAARQLGYKPNPLARTLRQGRSNMIGVIVDDIAAPSIGGIVRAIETYARKSMFTLILGNAENIASLESSYLEVFTQYWVDGIIFASGKTKDIGHLDSITSVPLVLAYCYSAHSDVPTVIPDNYGGALSAVNTLLDYGHTDICHITGPMDWRSSIERLRGYKDALHYHSLSCDSHLIQTGDWSFDSGYRAMQEILEKSRPRFPTALFVANDAMALGAIDAILAFGLSVPNDISVMGFDDSIIASYSRPRLSTVRIPYDSIGQNAFDLLLRLIDKDASVDSSEQKKYEQIEVPCEVVIRESIVRRG